MGIFNPDSKFSQFMSRVFDLMVLNLIFIITSIPIFTVGANYTALYYVTLKMAKNDESYVFKSYWKSWKQNFRQATGIWLIMLFVGIFIFTDIFLVNHMSGMIVYLKYVFLVMLVVWGMVLTYVFPVLARFDNTVKNTIKNSLLMSIRHLPWTIVMLIINLLPLIILMVASTTLVSVMTFFMMLLGTAVIALANSWFFANKIFPFYMPAEEEEEELSELEESSRVIEAMDRANTDFLENSGTPLEKNEEEMEETKEISSETEHALLEETSEDSVDGE